MTNVPAAAESSEFLIRSRQEVVRLLNGILASGAAFTMDYMNGDHFDAGALLNVDEAANQLIVECPTAWSERAADAASDEGENGDGSIMLTCMHESVKIQFQAGGLELTDLDGKPVVVLEIPEFMWRFQRRQYLRHVVSGLKITLKLGILESDAEVIDFALNGIGLLNCDSDVLLALGEELCGCTIALPGVGQVQVDMTVQHQTTVHQADGRQVTRVGCQFTRLDDSARQLMTHYLETLGKA